MIFANMYMYTNVSIIPQRGNILYIYFTNADNWNHECNTVSAFSGNMAEYFKQLWHFMYM